MKFTDVTKKAKSQYERKLLQRIQELTTDVGYWIKQHDRARKREEEFKKELKDKNARIRYLENQLYNKKTEKSKFKSEKKDINLYAKRKKGHQKGTPAHERRSYDNLETKPEVCDIPEENKICSACGKPLCEIASTDDSEILEIDVKGYKRKIMRKKYAKRCKCFTGKQELITAPGPVKLFKGSKIGILKKEMNQLALIAGGVFPKQISSVSKTSLMRIQVETGRKFPN